MGDPKRSALTSRGFLALQCKLFDHVPPSQALDEILLVMGEDVPEVINVPLHAFLIEIAVNAPTVAEMMDHIPVNAAEFHGKALFCPLIKTDRLSELDGSTSREN